MRPSAVHPFLRSVVATAAVMIVLSSDGPPALAHSMLVKAEPPRRAMLAKAPGQVRLWFNKDIEGDYASLRVLDADKHPVTDAKPTLVSDDPKSIVLPLPELAPGKYS